MTIGRPVVLMALYKAFLESRPASLFLIFLYLKERWMASSTPAPTAMEEKLTVMISKGMPRKYMKR